MLGRLQRVTGIVLVVAVAIVTPVLATSAPASADTVINGCTIVSNPTSTNFTNCPGADLSAASLAGVDLSFANLAGAFFANCDALEQCSAADLSGANLTSANLSSTTWARCEQVFEQCFDANLQNAVLTGSNLTDAVFASCTVSGIGNAFCGEPPNELALGEEVNLSGADLTDATVTGATFGTCLFFGPPGDDSAGCGGAILTGANLTGVNLTGIDLSGTTLIPPSQIVTATTAAGAVVTWPTPPPLTGATPGTCTPPSGSTFPFTPNPVVGTTVTCQVVDGFGNTTTGIFFVVVNAPPNSAPTTFVGIPSNGATVSGDSWLDAGASAQFGVASVSFELSGSSFSDHVIATGTRTLYGWLAQWDTTIVSNGTYTIQSVATDTFGQSTTSAPVTIIVNNPNPPRTVVIYPPDGATQSGTAFLDAVSTAGVTRVEYQLTGGTPPLTYVIATGTRTLYGWLAQWDTTSVPNGTYTLQSVGATSVGIFNIRSAPITITVSN